MQWPVNAPENGQLHGVGEPRIVYPRSDYTDSEGTYGMASKDIGYIGAGGGSTSRSVSVIKQTAQTGNRRSNQVQ